MPSFSSSIATVIFSSTPLGNVVRGAAERRAVLAKEKQVVEGRRILGVKRRGYRGLYEGTVNQAELGADFEFLTANGTLH